tara:strand:- start:344 stop:577 length:234 start_codon:yes stop_codon:yes gene_type:complete
MDQFGVVIFGMSGFLVGMWKLGRWSVKRKVVDLEKVKEQLLLSKNNHQVLIEEIDEKIKDINDYSKLRFFDKSTKFN